MRSNRVFGRGLRSLARMSASLTTPSTWPSTSTTGAPEIPRSESSAATSLSEVSGVTVSTSVVMTSAMRMVFSL